MSRRIPKELNKRYNDSSIVEQYIVPYTVEDDSFYKRIDELLLEDGKRIKATLSPSDMVVFPFGGRDTVIVTENRIDVIATKYYGKASLWRAIAYMNGIKDPLKLQKGTPLNLPSKRSLREYPNPLY